MALERKNLETLAKQIAAEMHPERIEVLLTTGEEFEGCALDIARTFARAEPAQKAAFIALAKAFDPEAWRGW